MIQRIQTLYLFIAIICLMIAQFGTSFFYLIGEKMYLLNAYGVFENTVSNDLTIVKNVPLFLAPVLLIVLLVVTIFSYKKLKNQLKTLNLVIYTYSAFILILLALFFSHFNFPEDKMDLKYQFGPAMYFIIVGYPALFLAKKGVQKDKKTLDSLNSNRLR